MRVSFSAGLPLGTNSVGISVTDSLNHSDACAAEVIVVDRTPPSLLSAKSTPDTLWPPNNQMVPVQIDALATDECGDTHWKIVGVLSNEPPGKPGHRAGHTDWQITGDHTLELRATRNGWGTGRVYSILLQAMDTSGNLSQTQIVTVAVSKSAHSQPQPATLELE